MNHFSYTIDKGAASNIIFRTVLTEKDFEYRYNRALKDFQKDYSIPGFRKGHVPLEMVKQSVKPEALTMGIIENITYAVMTDAIKNHSTYQFIGSMYDLDISNFVGNKEKSDDYGLNRSIDTYPETEAKNPKRQDKKFEPITIDITEDHLEKTLLTVAKQFAEYKEAQTVSDISAVRCQIQFFEENNDQEIHKKFGFFAEEEREQYPELAAKLLNKKVDDTIQTEYHREMFPQSMQYAGEKAAHHVIITIVDIKDVISPELTDAFIAEKFGEGDDPIMDKDTLRMRVKQKIHENTVAEKLQKTIDEYITSLMEDIVTVIPKTYIDNEVATRKKSFADQFGGEKRFNQYMESMNEDERNTFILQLSQTADTSLKKFFVLQYICKELGIDIQTPGELGVEKALYKQLTGSDISAQQ